MKGTQGHEQDGGEQIEPLTRCNAEGIVYRRDPTVERQIAEALRLPADCLRERAAVRDQQAPEFLKEECLVYLIRHYHRASEHRLVSDLSEVLLHRCANLINSHLRSLDPEVAVDGYNDVVARLFDQIIDINSDRGDFLQVRFWPVLKKLAIRVFNQQLKLYKRAQDSVPLSSLAGYDPDADDEDERVVRTRGQAAATLEELVVIRDALSRMEEPYRSAFLLKHYVGWPVADQDPNLRTISRHFGKDPRTIRNWLKKADEAVETWRGEQ